MAGLNKRLAMMIGGGVAALALMAGALGVSTLVFQKSNAQLIAEKKDNDENVVAARAAIASRMADAQSINFGTIYTHWTGDIPAVCGQVDIVEEQDSFDGQERFIYSDGALLLEEIDGTDTLTQRWRDLCE